MDTISRENNSMLPVGGIIVGVIALAFGIGAFVSLSSVKTKMAANQEKIDRIEDLSAQLSSVSAKADKTASDLTKVATETQNGFNTLGGMIGTAQASIKTLEENSKRAVVVKGAKGKGGAVVAGPGEYIVKAGDTPHKIAAANGCTVAELMAVNSGLDAKKLHPGQKLKLPEKGGAAPAAPAAAPATP
jgi:LysM repeat protein